MSSHRKLACCVAGAILTMHAAMFADDKGDALTALLETFSKEFVDITPGEGTFPQTFQMGSDKGDASEQPVHEVTLSDKFSIAKYEVPQNLYEAVMGDNPSKWKGPRNSVEMMTYNEAVAFCGKVTKLLQARELIAAEEIIRLPTGGIL